MAFSIQSRTSEFPEFASKRSASRIKGEFEEGDYFCAYKQSMLLHSK